MSNGDFSADGGQVEKEVDTEPLGAFHQVAFLAQFIQPALGV